MPEPKHGTEITLNETAAFLVGIFYLIFRNNYVS